MKKFLLGACALMAMTATAASPDGVWSQRPFSVSERPAVMARSDAGHKTSMRAPEADILIDEDFSGFPGGTEDQPSADPINPDTNNWAIDPSKTKQPGWRGLGIYEAGETIFFGAYEDYYGDEQIGYLSTPMYELCGTVKVTFRARRVEGFNVPEDSYYTQPDFWVALVEDDYYGPVEGVHIKDMGTDWQDYELTFTQGMFVPTMIIQFRGYASYFQLDDVKVVRMNDKVQTPTGLVTKNLSTTSFKANWGPVEKADRYLFSAWYEAQPENNVTGSFTQDFENIALQADGKTVDTSGNALGDGWTFEGPTDPEQSSELADVCNSGSNAINLQYEGEMITSPKAPAGTHINKFTFWVKPSSMVQEEGWYISMFSVYIYHENSGQWSCIASLPNYYLPDGGVYGFQGDDLGDDCTQVRLWVQYPMYGVTFAIDDLTVEYQSLPERKYIKENAETTETEITVEGMPEDAISWWNVSAALGDIVSDPSENMYFNAVSDLKPVATEATEITEDSFVANWDGLPRAADYLVDLSKSITATDSAIEDVVINEEDFSNVHGGTLENPEMDYSYQYSWMENGQANTDWTSTNVQWIEGMAGSRGTNEWTGMAGLLASPLLNLSNDGGKVTVDFKGIVTEADDEIVVMFIKTLFDTQSIYGVLVPLAATNQAETLQAVLNPAEMDGFTPDMLDNIMVAFMSKLGKAFYISDVTIKQNLQPGETAVIPVSQTLVEGKSVKFSGLDSTFDYRYTVMAHVKKMYMDYYSLASDPITVKLGTSGVEEMIADGELTLKAYDGALEFSGKGVATVYTLDGMKLFDGKVDGVKRVEAGKGMVIVRINGNKSAKIML